MQCLEAKKTKRKRKSYLKNKPFSPPQRNPRKPNLMTPSKLLNPPQNCHQPTSKHQNCWYPCQPNPNPVPPPQDLHTEIERWERKHQPPSKHQNCWYPRQPNPNLVPPPQDLHTEIERWERKLIHHPSSARFRQPKAKKVERESVRWAREKEKRKKVRFWKTKIEREREYSQRWDWEKEKRWESKTLLLMVDVNTVCVEGLDGSFSTRCGCV